MAQTNKPAFFRPVEIRTGVNDVIVLKKSGGTNRTVTINPGTYSSIMAVLDAYNYAVLLSNYWLIDGETATFAVYYGNVYDPLYYTLHSVATLSTTTNIYFQNDTTRQMFGFASDPGAGTSIYSPYPVEYCWVPRYQTATQARFQLNQKDIFSGIQVKSGGLAGVETGPSIQYLDCKFVNENAANLMESACPDANMIYKAAEYFFTLARTASPATSGNARMNGLWYYPNLNDVIDGFSRINVYPGATDGATYTYEGIHFDYDSSPDLYAWCAIEKDGVKMATPSAPTGREYWQIEFTINKDTDIPTFEAPDQVS